MYYKCKYLSFELSKTYVIDDHKITGSWYIYDDCSIMFTKKNKRRVVCKLPELDTPKFSKFVFWIQIKYRRFSLELCRFKRNKWNTPEIK